jgi:broad specificity phosphatase PhoE
MQRARQTAGPIARACGLTLQFVEPLHERSIGPLSGLRFEEVWPAYDQAKERWKDGQLEYTHEGGESYAAVRRRVVPAFQAIADRHPGETIVIVAHGMVIRVLLTSLLEGLGPADFDRVAIDFVAINDLRFSGGRWRADTLGERAITRSI